MSRNDKRVAHGVVPSTENGRGSHIKSNSSTEIVTDSGENVKGQHSISAPGRQDIVRDLRGILERGGDPAELRRYVDSLEQNTRSAEQNAEYADQNGTEAEQTARREERTADAARKILQTARNEGLSVEEYLSQNWELYEVDGQWDADARAALELEHRESRAKHSISKPAGVDKTADGGDNGATETDNGGIDDDDRRVREGTAGSSGLREGKWQGDTHGRANTTNTARAKGFPGWKEVDSGVRKKILRLVRSRVRTSSSASFLYDYLLASVGRNDATVTQYMYNKAVERLCENLYYDASEMHPAVFENKWKFMGGSITDLYNSIRAEVEEADGGETSGNHEAKHSISKSAVKNQEDPAAEERGGKATENTFYVYDVFCMNKEAMPFITGAQKRALPAALLLRKV